MRAILLVARSEARRRRAALLGLALLVALVGAAVMGSVAGARRSASAIDRFREVTDARDGRAFAFVLGADVADDLRSEVGGLDGVSEVGVSAIYGTDASFDIDTTIVAPLDDVPYQRLDVPVVLDGRLPDPEAADEVVLSEAAVEHLGLHTGDRLQVHTFGQEDCAALSQDDFLGFNGPALDLEVVGEVRVIEELQGSQLESGPLAIGTPAFAAAHDDACAVGVFASARYEAGRGPSDQEMTAATRRAAPETGDIGAGSIESEFLDGVQSAVDLVTVALIVFAGVTGAAGLLALVQAVGRQISASADVDDDLTALGLTRTQRGLGVAIPLAVAAVPGALLGVLGAVAVSARFPLGVARRAEPDPGVRVDPLILGMGVVLLVALVGGTAFLVHRRRSRRSEDSRARTRVVAGAASAGASPVVLVGLGLVGDRRGGRSAVRTAIVGAAVALAGISAVLVMTASLHDVLDQPDRYGWPWDSKPDLDSDDPEATIAAIAEEEDVSAVGVLDQATLDVDGDGVEGFAMEEVKGAIDFPVLDGREPASTNEIALGAGALEGTELGDTVALRTAEGTPRELEVVGRVVLPHFDSVGAATALIRPELIPELGVDEDKNLVLSYADGADVEALESRLEEEHGLSFPTYARPNPPGRLQHLDDIKGLFGGVAAFFVVLGLLGLAHALAAATRRDRPRFATLRSLGFVRGQVARAVLVASVSIIAVGAVIGLPVGVVIGRLVWRASVGDLGILETPSVPLGPVLAVVLAAMAVTVLVAVVPAWRAARRHPVDALRVA